MSNHLLLLSFFLLALGSNARSDSSYDDQSFELFAATIFKAPEFIKSRKRCEQYDLRTQNDEVIECFEEEAVKHPGSPAIQYLLGVAHVYGGNLAKTKQQYDILKPMSVNFSRLLLHVAGTVQPAWLEELIRYYRDNN